MLFWQPSYTLLFTFFMVGVHLMHFVMFFCPASTTVPDFCLTLHCHSQYLADSQIMHQSFGTWGRAGASCGNVLCFYFSIAPQCRGNARDLCFIGKVAVQCKHNRLLGKMAVVLPTGCPRSVGLLAGICWTKSQSPRYTPGLQMTGALE